MLFFAFVLAASGAYAQLAKDKNSGRADIPNSIAESVSSTLQFSEGNLLGLADAMPEDKYSFVPTNGNFQGVRSFGEQIKHIACAQFAFFNEFEGPRPSGYLAEGPLGAQRELRISVAGRSSTERSIASHFAVCRQSGN
jgi:hypothetical protein